MSSQLIFTENLLSAATPTPGKITIYAKTDKVIYSKNDTGVETPIISTAAITQLTGDVTSPFGPGSVATVVAFVGGKSAASIATSVGDTVAATNSNTPSTIVKRDASGNFSAGTITATLIGNASTATAFTGSLVGDVTGTQGATIVSFVGGSSASNVNAATILANASTAINTASTIVRRDASGNFAATNITANLTGTASGNPPNARAINTTAPLTGGGDLSADRTLSMHVADATHDGYISSTDWATFSSTSGAAITALTGDVVATGPGSVTATIQPGAIDNAKVSATAAIAYSKLNLTNSIVNADVAAAAAIAYSKLNLTGSVTNADLAGSITYAKLILTNSIVNADINTAAAIAYSKLALSNTIVNADINASAAIAYSKLNLSASIVDADVAGSAAIALSKLASLTANRALVSNGSGVIAVSIVTDTELGYVSGVTSAIQTQLNGKQATLTFGNLTDVGTDGITVTGGTGAVIGSGTSIAQHVADSTHNGYLSSAAFNTFSATAANAITSLTGDATATGPGAVALTLATVNSNVGSFGSSTAIPNFTVNAKGLITAAGTSAVIAPAGTLTGTTLASNVVTSSLTAVGTIVTGVWNGTPITYANLSLTGSIVNADINAAAAIAYSKLNLTGSIVNADVNAAAAIAYSKLALTNTIVNADVNASAAIAYSKLNLAGSIVNADVNAAAAIAYSKLNLAGSIVNADVNASAAIALSKLASLTANRAVVTNGSGVLIVSSVTDTELGYLSGVTSAIQTQLNGKQATGNYITALTGDVVAAGPGSAAATIQPGAIDNSKVSATAAIAYSKLNLAGSIVNADVNASAAIAYSKLNLSASIVNADVAAAAAIAGTKISPSWGSQNTTTTGTETAASFNTNGTAGAGFVQFTNQASAPSTPTSAVRLYADSSNRFSWIGTNGFTRTFDGTANTANRVYVLPDAAGTIKLQTTSQTIAANTALTDGVADLILYITTSSPWTITLPNPANNTNRRITFKDVSGTMETNAVTIARFGAEKIENLAASKVVSANFGAFTFISDGTNWWSL